MDTLFLLICGHFIADYPLQGDFLAKGKNRLNPIPHVPFYQCLIAHAMIHGWMVFLCTESLLLGALEVVSHALIDDAKCTGKISFNTDQALHIFCKILWTVMFLTLGLGTL